MQLQVDAGTCSCSQKCIFPLLVSQFTQCTNRIKTCNQDTSKPFHWYRLQSRVRKCMQGQLSVTCLRLWSVIWPNNHTGAVGPLRSRTWHYYFQLIQQLLNLATWSSGLFLFHKDPLNAVLCKQPVIQELTISVSKLQLCSLFPVSFSNCRWPLQPKAMAAVPSVFFKTEKDPGSRLQNWVFSSWQIRTLWSDSWHLIDGLNPSIHQLGLSLQYLGVLDSGFLFIWILPSTHPRLVLEARMPPVTSASKISSSEVLQKAPITPLPGDLRCDSTRRQRLLSAPSFSNRFTGSMREKMAIIVF